MPVFGPKRNILSEFWTLGVDFVSGCINLFNSMYMYVDYDQNTNIFSYPASDDYVTADFEYSNLNFANTQGTFNIPLLINFGLDPILITVAQLYLTYTNTTGRKDLPGGNLQEGQGRRNYPYPVDLVVAWGLFMNSTTSTSRFGEFYKPLMNQITPIGIVNTYNSEGVGGEAMTKGRPTNLGGDDGWKADMWLFSSNPDGQVYTKVHLLNPGGFFKNDVTWCNGIPWIFRVAKGRALVFSFWATPTIYSPDKNNITSMTNYVLMNVCLSWNSLFQKYENSTDTSIFVDKSLTQELVRNPEHSVICDRVTNIENIGSLVTNAPQSEVTSNV